MIRVAWVLAGTALSWGAGAASAEVVAVVSARSSLATLSKSQVADIFLGKSIRYPDGSLAAPIDQVEGSATREEFYLAFAGKSPSQLNAHWSKIIFTGRGQPPPEVANGVAVKRHLAENPNAIGYIEPALVDASVKVLAIP